ncbi:conserved hypothetical protein [Culex quinquefasciatus]|uniref:Uncharacterized protein n=1 Tax=Culex quinquefasciatus TaxID=7176 RepID=B0WP35_CULQU|nr:conserved hypothetical protein [Culex quinquefasciatus]|eukprot:XP_001850469.1 conserved hypothetical protein [Culex quinquefasciatus]
MSLNSPSGLSLSAAQCYQKSALAQPELCTRDPRGTVAELRVGGLVCKSSRSDLAVVHDSALRGQATEASPPGSTLGAGSRRTTNRQRARTNISNRDISVLWSAEESAETQSKQQLHDDPPRPELWVEAHSSDRAASERCDNIRTNSVGPLQRQAGSGLPRALHIYCRRSIRRSSASPNVDLDQQPSQVPVYLLKRYLFSEPFPAPTKGLLAPLFKCHHRRESPNCAALQPQHVVTGRRRCDRRRNPQRLRLREEFHGSVIQMQNRPGSWMSAVAVGGVPSNLIIIRHDEVLAQGRPQVAVLHCWLWRCFQAHNSPTSEPQLHSSSTLHIIIKLMGMIIRLKGGQCERHPVDYTPEVGAAAAPSAALLKTFLPEETPLQSVLEVLERRASWNESRDNFYLHFPVGTSSLCATRWPFRRRFLRLRFGPGSTATMELLTAVPLVLLTVQQTLATSSTEAQDYVLRAIEYLVICGFERHDLHRAGRWEKTVFLALIILMFFLTNAFETKIVSLMTSKPSIQRIKTLTDLFQSDVKFRYDLENSPHLADDLVVGPLIVQGETPDHGETFPGVGMLCLSEWCEITQEISFDYERMQPFYVLLDYESLDLPECYPTGHRFIFAETFRTMHSTLTEAGLFILWKRQWSAELRSAYSGRRPREDAQKNAYLSFDDMQPAWMALGIGMGISLFVFLTEYSTKWSLKDIRKCFQNLRAQNKYQKIL